MQTGAPILARLESGIYQIQCRLDDLEWKVDALNRKLDLILEEFAVWTYVADPPSSPSVGNTGWSGPAWIEETFGGSGAFHDAVICLTAGRLTLPSLAGGGLNAIGTDHNPRIAPNDTLLQPGTLYLGQLNSMGTYLRLVMPNPRVLPTHQRAARTLQRFSSALTTHVNHIACVHGVY